ncbi:MAG TPA: M12 family metallo-peptidase [Candidatus Binatia bacterium]|nr:M12 family metallo-peptidase [Candidatus Binatia bacterium]
MRVQVLADVSFRARNPNWRDEARDLIESASDYYEREFDIRFIAQTVSAWPEKDRVRSTPELLARVKSQFGPEITNDYDLIVTFTAEGISRVVTAGRPRVDRIGNCNQGLARYAVLPVTKIFQYQGANSEPEFDVLALIHELGHVFGAEHVEDTNSIMHEDFGYRTEFDAKNRAIIQKNRFCAFARK